MAGRDPVFNSSEMRFRKDAQKWIVYVRIDFREKTGWQWNHVVGPDIWVLPHPIHNRNSRYRGVYLKN